MKSFSFIIGMILLYRALLWLFPNSDALISYAFLPLGLLGAGFIVWIEGKNSNLQPE